MEKIKLSILILVFLFIAPFVFARTFVVDWYIKDFQTEILVNRDSSLLITERIIADSGNLPDKHGIFRILPEKAGNIDGGTRKTPVELVSITDFEGRPHVYRAIKDRMNDTITWKIGDPNITVKGENYYKITYKVYNAVHNDVFYWNLLGNFWDLEIDNFNARVVFPSEITRDDISFDYYTGLLGQRGKSATYRWINDNTLEITANEPLSKRQGITLEAYLPAGYFAPHQFGFLELYLSHLYFLIPFLALILSFNLWHLHGRDYKNKKPVLTEFLRPREMDLLEAGMFMSNGKMDPKFITALIVDMAVKGALMIEEEEKKIIFIPYKETVLKKLDKKESLTEMEVMVFEKIFQDKDEIGLVSLRSIFPKEIKEIQKEAKAKLIEKNLFYEKGFDLQKKMGLASVIFMILALLSIFILMDILLFASLFITFAILALFAILMPKRTKEGVDLHLYLKGLKKYMSIAEKERQAFYEEENIFEKLLPYAIIFGITHKWAKKMEVMYGKEFFQNYSPAWWQGGSVGKGDFNSFSKSLNTLSSQISSSHSSGGSGGSGGGGGGGGGGGW